jgi:restriction endonuclease Mrr
MRLKKNLKKLKKQLEEQVKELQTDLENKNKEYNFLQNKVNRFQKRENFPDKNVIYIITCDELEKDRIYIFGKAVDLKHRLSSYNKSLEHKVMGLKICIR